MKHYIHLLLAALALTLLGACSVKEEAPADAGRAIRFTTNLGGFAVRATDTEFEAGDAVSLFADGAIGKYNVKMNYASGELIPEEAISWPEGENGVPVKVNFLAVYPYDAAWEYGTDANAFTVCADQTTHANYTASDLMIATYMAYSDCETVPLNFTHRMSRFDLNIQSILTDELTAVYLSGVYGKAQVGINFPARAVAVGEKGTVKMGCTSSNSVSGSNIRWSSWSAILPPQIMDFKILMVTASGKQYTYCLSEWNEGTRMESACKYQGYLELGKYSEPGDFSVEVSQWTDNTTVQFGSFVPDEFQTEGYWYVTETNPTTGVSRDLDFTPVYDANDRVTFSLYIDNTPGNTYELYYTRNDVNIYAYGFRGDTSEPKDNGTYPFVTGGTPLKFSAQTDLILELNPYTKELTVRPDNDVWTYIGDFDGDNWTKDYEMERVRAGVYTATIAYYGESFKFRCNGSWDINLGLPKSWTSAYANRANADNGKPVTEMEMNGGNIALDAVGFWQIELNVHENFMRAVYLGNNHEWFNGYYSYLGNWTCDDYSISISEKSPGRYLINFAGLEYVGRYFPADDGFKVDFQKLGEVNTQYGLAYLYFYSEAVYPDDHTAAAARFMGEYPGIYLFSGKISQNGGSIEISDCTI